MNVYFKNNSTVFWDMILIFALLFLGIGSIYAHPSTGDGQDDKQKTIYVYRADGGRYFLLEAGEGALYFPLSTKSKAWAAIKEWNDLSEKFAKYFPFKNPEDAKIFQGKFGTAADGNWGAGSWLKMAEWLMKVMGDNGKEVEISDIIFKLEREPNFFKNPPKYKEISEFFLELALWENSLKKRKENLKEKMYEAEIPYEVKITAGSDSSKAQNWILKLASDQFEVNVDPPDDKKKYIVDAKIENYRIYIKRVPEVYSNIVTHVTLKLKIEHPEFRDVRESVDLLVYFPGEPCFKVLSKFISQYAPILFLIFFIVALILGYLLGRYREKSKRETKALKDFRDVMKGLIGDNKNEVLKKISSLYGTFNLYKGLQLDVKDIIEEILDKIPNRHIYEDKNREWKSDDPLIVKTLENLTAIKKYVETSRKKEDQSFQFFMNVNNNLLDYSRRISSFEDDYESTDRAEILNTMYNSIKEQFGKFEGLRSCVKQILEPFAEDEDYVRFVSEEFWSAYKNENQYIPVESENLREKILNLEIRFPSLLKFIEDQLQRTSLITEKILKPRIQSLSEYNIVKDIDELSSLFSHKYFGEKGSRPDWTDRLLIKPSREEKQDLQDKFWEKVWDGANLGESIQTIQRIIFKLKLIVNAKNSIDIKIFKDAYELAMAAEAVMFILQGIALSCGRIYHVLVPGNKANEDFVLLDGDPIILKDNVFKNLSEKYNWQPGDICDVSYWGMSMISSKGFKQTVESRIVMPKQQEPKKPGEKSAEDLFNDVMSE